MVSEIMRVDHNDKLSDTGYGPTRTILLFLVRKECPVPYGSRVVSRRHVFRETLIRNFPVYLVTYNNEVKISDPFASYRFNYCV